MERGDFCGLRCRRWGRRGFVGGLDGDRLRVLFEDDALDDAAVGEAEDVDLVFARDDAAGVEDVVEDVVEVVALRAGELGGDLGAFAEEAVAVGAGFGEDGAAVGQIGRFERVGGELRS